MPPKRKRSTVSTTTTQESPAVIIPNGTGLAPGLVPAHAVASYTTTNPNVNGHIIDGVDASRASPDRHANAAIAPNLDTESSLSSLSDEDAPKKRAAKRKAPVRKKKAKVNGDGGHHEVTPARLPKTSPKVKVEPGDGAPGDPEAEGVDEPAGEEEIKQALVRPPPVNSDYLPLPWKGRLGYACLNTYLRSANPPVFSSRTCRIASILEHRHPLTDPTQPEHATKNRPNKELPADIRRGQEWVEQLGIQNAKDIVKMIRWNEKYGIKFMRLSSEMFPFASHEEYGYKLAPFASEALGEAGRVVAELGHRVTTHPGQYTQLGSPRAVVVENAIRDLEYHDEMLSLLKLPPQQDRDAVMILHMGGVFGSKPETLERFRQNYARLSQSVKNRLVLENDDMSWSVHDLLPVCEELNIPMVLDYHHHNIIFDSSQIREGTKDIVDLYPRIWATWRRKNITPKTHYSEPTPAAITGQQRRKHSPRVATLPPCPPDMDLMIEAKDKEQAVFELMRIFKLPGHERINNIIPYVREDENKAALATIEKMQKKKNKKSTPKKVKDEDIVAAAAEEVEAEEAPLLLPEDEVGMGGPDGRVYWPPTMEEYLRPKKKVMTKKDEVGEGSVGSDLDGLMKKLPKHIQKAILDTDKRLKQDQVAGLKGRRIVTPEPFENGATDTSAKGSKKKQTKKQAVKLEAPETEESAEEPTPAPKATAKRRGKVATTAVEDPAEAATPVRSKRRRVNYAEQDGSE